MHLPKAMCGPRLSGALASHLDLAGCRQVRVPTGNYTPNCSSQIQNPKHPSDHHQGYMDENPVSKGGVFRKPGPGKEEQNGIGRLTHVDMYTQSFIVCV